MASDFTYHGDVGGDVGGDGINELRFELAKRTTRHSKIRNAWLARIQYRGENNMRVLLLIDTHQTLNTERQHIVNDCSDVIPMDIIFADTLADHLLADIQQQSKALYLDGNNLYDCPILVEPGNTNSEQPQWVGAIIDVYVADTDHESALTRSVAHIRKEGYVVAGVHENRVDQLDPNHWWEGHVLGNWAEHADHFPSQTDLDALIRCGGIFSGPTLAWESDTE